MDEPQTTSENPPALLLRVLSGIQAGAEARLTDGDYWLGTSEDCDLVLQDLPADSIPLQLRIQDNVVRIKTAATTVRVDGRILESDVEDTLALNTTISYGGLCFALGTAQTDWAAIPLPTSSEQTEPEPAERDNTSAPKSAAPPTSSDPAFATLTEDNSGKRSRVRFITLTLLGLMLLGLILLGSQVMGWIWADSAQKVPHQSPSDRVARVKAIAGTLGLHDITVTMHSNETLVLTGYCDTQAVKARLSQSLRKAGIPVENRLWPEDALQQDVAKTLQELAGDRVSFRYPKPGTIELQGYLPSIAALDHLQAIVYSDVPGVVQIISQVKTLPDVVVRLREQLDAAGLGQMLKVAAHEHAIRVSGVLDAAAIARWRELMRVFHAQYPQEPELELHIAPLSEVPPSEMPKLALRGILVGEDGRAYAALSQGRHIREGDRLGDGSIVESIRLDRVILRKGTQLRSYYVGDTSDE